MTKTRLALLLGSLGLVATGVAIGCGDTAETPIVETPDAAPEAAALPAPTTTSTATPPPANGQASCTGDCLCDGSVCACAQNGTCVFGAGDAGGADGGGLANDVTYNCNTKGTCNVSCGTGCTTTCEGQSTCAGSCAANCVSTCSGTSNCALDTGPDSSVTVSGGADASVVIGVGSTLTCTGNSQCSVQCPAGGCTTQCNGTAVCNIHCSGDAGCSFKCNNGAAKGCEAGTTCTDVCH